MLYSVLADLTMATHMAFVLFVALGGFMVVRWAWVAWLHVPSFLWGAWISIVGWVCPLTPLENRFRRLAGESGYEEAFLERYLFGLLYPAGLTRAHFVAIGIGVLLLNGAIYARILLARRRRRAAGR
jgi:hypothetical protein